MILGRWRRIVRLRLRSLLRSERVDVDQRMEETRDARGVRFVDDALRDLRYAARMMVRSPGVTAVAVLSLALGIGANTAIFSAVDELMLQTLPVAHPERLIMFFAAEDSARGDSLPYPRFEEIQQHLTSVFASVISVWSIDRANMIVNPAGAGASAEPDAGLVRVGSAAANYFDTLGVATQIGRAFTASDNRVPGGHPVAVISDAYWDRRFGRTRDITNRTFSVNGATYQILGVAAKGFSGEWVGMPTDL